jgi:TniQ
VDHQSTSPEGYLAWKIQQEERLRQREAEKQMEVRLVQNLSPLPQRVAPRPWEDLASLLSRTARKMGYEHPQWLLRPEQIAYKISASSLPLLRRRADYLMLGRLLSLDEAQIYDLTLHRFAGRFRAGERPDPSTLPLPSFLGVRSFDIEYSLLWTKHLASFFHTDRTTRVCPCCLDDGESYDRLYWRCMLVVSCPRHAVYLTDRCPACRALIPALRSTAATCPTCRKGDYRSTVQPVLPEDRWLVQSQSTLLHHLGLDAAELGERHRLPPETSLGLLPPWDYFQLFARGLSALQPLSWRSEAAIPFLMQAMGLQPLVTRMARVLHAHESTSNQLLLLHYLLGAWPTYVPAFLERLRRLLQEGYHYHRQSECVRRWDRMMILGNYWCVTNASNQSTQFLTPFFETLQESFEQLLPVETVQSYKARVLVMSTEPMAMDRVEPAVPYHRESLTSLLMRVAAQRGYSYTGYFLHDLDDGQRFWPAPREFLFMTHHTDLGLLGKELSLDEETLTSLTLHRFAPSLQAATFPDHAQGGSSLPGQSGRSFLRHCVPRSTTKVCSACLSEEPAYDRLYWNIREVLICPCHRYFLLDRCPTCHSPIPSLREPELVSCPYCRRGDYRLSPRAVISPNSLLYQSQRRLLLHFLGVSHFNSDDSPALLQGPLLKWLEPWQYFDLLDRFSAVAPYLRPERTLAAVCRRLGLPEEPASYGQLDHGRRVAVQVSLFHALGMSWPEQVLMIFSSRPRLEEFSLQSDSEQDDQEMASRVYALLIGLFEAEMKRGQLEVLQRQQWASQRRSI